MFERFYYNDISTAIRRTDMKLINLNCITNSCNWYTYVTWRGNEYELSEDEHDGVETCSSVIIYKLICNCAFVGLFYKIILKMHGTCIEIKKISKIRNDFLPFECWNIPTQNPNQWM